MPVVINEIQIITTVGEASAEKSGEKESGAKKSGLSDKEKQAIITSCIDEVMRIMKEKDDR